MEHTHTVFVLQGGAHVGPQEWWARSIRCPALSAPDAAKTPGARDEAKVAVLSVIVGGLRGLSSSERSREERKYRDAVSKMRSCMFHLLRSGKLAPATLPVSIEVERESLGETGALGGLIEERLSAVVKAAAGGAGGAGAGTDAGSGMGTGAETGAGRARGKKRPRVLPKAPKRIKVKVAAKVGQLLLELVKSCELSRSASPPTHLSTSAVLLLTCCRWLVSGRGWGQRY